MTTTTPRPLSSIRASEVMHGPIVRCDPTTDLHHIATRMVAHRIHAVLVDSGDPDGPALVSADDLVRVSVRPGPGVTAAAIPSEPAVRVDVDATLTSVAETLGREHRSHVLVVDGDRAVGILSSLDVVAALAGSEGA